MIYCNRQDNVTGLSFLEPARLQLNTRSESLSFGGVHPGVVLADAQDTSSVGGFGMLTESVIRRFWEKVNKNGPVVREDLGPCWVWLGKTDDGYGRFKISIDGVSRAFTASRIAYEIVEGLIPPGLSLDHLCRNRICVRPSHLEPVTNRVNVLRGNGACARNAAKTACPKGHPYNRENTRIDRVGGRVCRTCAAVRSAAWNLKLRLSKKVS